MRNNAHKIIEVLSPAKNLQYGIEAVKAGADSVYIACEKLSLRKRFTNSTEDIKKLCEYAHKFWCKVYVTINSTIYTDEDMDYVEAAIKNLYDIGVDAVIISDMGILMLDLPPIPIFASVNTRCFTPEKVKFMEQIGISRIILPRELTFEEIKEIARQTTIPLEVFIHGTFCVAYSGNCYLKYGQSLKRTKGNKDLRNYQDFSSNNGSCIANCTDIYSLTDADGNYIVKNDNLLGLHYLNLIDEIEKFISIGIHSFKIEGRQRELSYVKNITALSSMKVDNILKNGKNDLNRLSSGTSIINFEPNLDKTYNRGFTNYFFNGRKKENLSIYEPFGVYIGKVASQKNNTFIMNNNNIKLNVGDKILCKKEDNPTFTINIVDNKDNKYTFDFENKDITNCDLYRVINACAVEEVEKVKNYRYIRSKINIEQTENIYNIEIIDEDGIKADYKSEIDTKKSKISKEKLMQLFNCEPDDLIKTEKIISDNDIYLNEFDIKEIKTFLYTQLIKNRERNRPKNTGCINKNSTIKYPEKINYLDNINNSKAISFYKQHGIENPELGLEHTKNIEGKQIYTGRYCIRYELGFCSKLNKASIPKLPWFLEDKYNNKYKIEFDCSKCEMHILF